MNVSPIFRCISYGWHCLVESADFYIEIMESNIQSPLASTAAKVAAWAVASLVTGLLSPKAVLCAWAAHSLLDMRINATDRLRWDEWVCQGINMGLGIRATLLLAQGIFSRTLSPLLWGSILAGNVLFKADWDESWVELRRSAVEVISRSQSIKESSVG